ncbi:tandem C2 domains nuclear protein isoform 2-T3 [Menidia menidia]
MECIKNCCKNFMRKKDSEQEIQVIRMKMPPEAEATFRDKPVERGRGDKEDYITSKLPPDGREVPFVLPTFKPSYVQPNVDNFTNLKPGPQGSARSTYAERKAELQGTPHFGYCQESTFHQRLTSANVSPSSTHHYKSRNSSSGSTGANLKLGRHQRLSSSMLDLPHNHAQGYDSMSSTFSSVSSRLNSIESSLDSITLSGDEQDLGKVCVRLNYKEALEQVWITLVQCSDLNLQHDGAEQQRIGFKAIITTSKPIEFKSSVREFSEDVAFMETFVFALRLQQLRSSSLVLRLQTHKPKKCTVAECVLSLQQLGPEESEHWLDLNSPSKSSVCQSELHLGTCFQAVNGRIQLQVLAAQNLPASTSPLPQVFFVKAELHQLGEVIVKKKTHALKASRGECRWEKTFFFPLASLEHTCSLSVKLCSRNSIRRKHCLGQVKLGFDSPLQEAVEHWKDTMSHPEKVVKAWHRLSPS